MNRRMWQVAGTAGALLLFGGVLPAWGVENTEPPRPDRPDLVKVDEGGGGMGVSTDSEMLNRMASISDRMVDWKTRVSELEDRLNGVLAGGGERAGDPRIVAVTHMVVSMDQMVPPMENLLGEVQRYVEESDVRGTPADTELANDMMDQLESWMKVGNQMMKSLETMSGVKAL